VRVFVLCPPNCGGVDREALEQLVLCGLGLGFDVTLTRVWESPADDGVEALHAPVDAPDSIIVVSELELARLLEFRLARRVIWWCNVERFAGTNEGLRRALGRARGPLDFAFDEQFPCVHWARSVHAQRFLKLRGTAASLLGGYIEPETLAQAAQLRSHPRTQLVLYDDQSAPELVQQIMLRVPSEVRWVGSSQVAQAEMPALLAQAKVYLDLSAHSDFGPLLCTAVAAGAVPIVGTQGCAGNDIDLPIPETYKFDERGNWAADAIAGQLCRVLSDHAKHSADFTPFRAWLDAGQAAFTEQVFARLGALEAAERRAQRLAV
jgi:hypothetical protein